jgi:hypothetical protein
MEFVAPTTPTSTTEPGSQVVFFERLDAIIEQSFDGPKLLP